MELRNFPDPRTPLEKIRRVNLQKLLRANDIPFNHLTAPATMLRQLVEQNGIDYMNFDYTKKLKVVEVKTMEPIVPESPAIPEEQNIVDMTRPQLMRLCKERGLKPALKDKKTDLIEKLNGDQTSE